MSAQKAYSILFVVPDYCKYFKLFSRNMNNNNCETTELSKRVINNILHTNTQTRISENLTLVLICSGLFSKSGHCCQSELHFISSRGRCLPFVFVKQWTPRNVDTEQTRWNLYCKVIKSLCCIRRGGAWLVLMEEFYVQIQQEKRTEKKSNTRHEEC